MCKVINLFRGFWLVWKNPLSDLEIKRGEDIYRKVMEGIR